jgi:hypothetical protein
LKINGINNQELKFVEDEEIEQFFSLYFQKENKYSSQEIFKFLVRNDIAKITISLLNIPITE